MHVQAPDVVRRSLQVRLDHGADVAVALPPQRVEDLERRVGVRRVLHVDAHEEPVRIGRLEDAAQVVDRGGPVDVEAELRQLERDVALDAGGDDRVDDLHVVAAAAAAAAALDTLSPR